MWSDTVLLSLGPMCLYTVYSLQTKISNILDQITNLNAFSDCSPSELLQLFNSSQASHLFKQHPLDPAIMTGKALVTGIVQAQQPLIRKGQSYVYLLELVRDIFSIHRINDQTSQSNIQMVPAFQVVQEGQEAVMVKIVRNLKVNVDSVLQQVSLEQYYLDLTIMDRIHIFFSDIMYILLMIFNSVYNFRGVKIGESRSIFGIPIGKMLCVYGDLNYNKNNNQLTMTPSLIVNQKEEMLDHLLDHLTYSIFNKKVKQVLCGGLGVFLCSYVFRKWYRMSREYYIKWNEGYFKRVVADDLQCCVCMDAPRTIICVPCKHMAICKLCYEKLPSQICPICKVPIQDTIQVYAS